MMPASCCPKAYPWLGLRYKSRYFSTPGHSSTKEERKQTTRGGEKSALLVGVDAEVSILPFFLRSAIKQHASILKFPCRYRFFIFYFSNFLMFSWLACLLSASKAYCKVTKKKWPDELGFAEFVRKLIGCASALGKHAITIEAKVQRKRSPIFRSTFPVAHLWQVQQQQMATVIWSNGESNWVCRC